MRSERGFELGEGLRRFVVDLGELGLGLEMKMVMADEGFVGVKELALRTSSSPFFLCESAIPEYRDFFFAFLLHI